MGIVLVDAWRVARLEVRRYFRWRPLRRWLAGGVLLSLAGSLAVVLVLEYIRLPLLVLRLVFALWYNLPVLVGLSAVLSLTPRLINDRTKRSMLIDLYLTSLHPMGIVLGKVVAATLLAGWLMLATLPPCALIVPTFQISLLQWLQGMLSGWFSLLLPAALMARLQRRVLPEGASPTKYRFAPTVLGAMLWTAIVLAFFAFLYGWNTTTRSAAFVASFSLIVPFGVALYANSTWMVGSLELPVA